MSLPSHVVVDASVAVKWVLWEPDTPIARMLRNCRLSAPPLFISECANVIWRNVRTGGLPAERAAAIAGALVQSKVVIHGVADMVGVVGTAVDLNHPAYDCEYLLLAEALRAPLVTADARLIRVARGSDRFAPLVLPLADLG